MTKNPSVREAIIELRHNVGDKVFTKVQLKEIIEMAYPELNPVASKNLDASITRAKPLLDVVSVNERRNI